MRKRLTNDKQREMYRAKEKLDKLIQLLFEKEIISPEDVEGLEE